MGRGFGEPASRGPVQHFISNVVKHMGVFKCLKFVPCKDVYHVLVSEAWTILSVYLEARLAPAAAFGCPLFYQFSFS
jgi:hypothetical protein